MNEHKDDVIDMKKTALRLIVGAVLLGMALAGGVLLQGRYLLFRRVDTSLRKEFPEVRFVHARLSRSCQPDDDCSRSVVLADDEALFSFGIHLHEDADYCNGERCSSLADLKQRIMRGLDVNGIVNENVQFVPVRLYFPITIPYGHFIKVLDICAEVGLKNFVFFEHVYGNAVPQMRNQLKTETGCPLSYGFPVDLSVRYANRVLVEVDEDDTVKIDGMVVEGEEDRRAAFSKARAKVRGDCHVDILFKAVPMARMKAVRDCILAASYVGIHHYYVLGQSTAGNRWSAVRLDMARSDTTLWGEMRYSLKAFREKTVVAVMWKFRSE